MVHFETDFNRDIAMDHILVDRVAGSKKQALEIMAQEAAHAFNIKPESLIDRLDEQFEQDNITIGNGVAIPALLIRNIPRSFALFMQLRKGVDCNAIDGQAIDLFCLMISPAEIQSVHLRRLSRLTRLLKNFDLCEKLRGAQDAQTLGALLHNPEGWMLAA
jgi:PTS system nitrogen regulatory IIA component